MREVRSVNNLAKWTSADSLTGVFNYDVGIMPYRRAIDVVVGRPIPILQSKNPDPAYVDSVHEQYTTELLRLWEDWKDVFARERKGELEIVE